MGDQYAERGKNPAKAEKMKKCRIILKKGYSK
jgi:hypothetical protein